MRTKSGILAAGLGVLWLTAPIAAHHGFDTEYDASKKFTLMGVVQKVEWQNSHIRVYVNVTNASGKVTTWHMELTSTNTVRRQGWGPKVTVTDEKVTLPTYGR